MAAALAQLCGQELANRQHRFEQTSRIPPLHRPAPAARACLQGKDAEILQQLLEAQARGQPVLVGAGSVQESEALVARLAPQLRCGQRWRLLSGLPQQHTALLAPLPPRLLPSLSDAACACAAWLLITALQVVWV